MTPGAREALERVAFAGWREEAQAALGTYIAGPWAGKVLALLDALAALSPAPAQGDAGAQAIHKAQSVYCRWPGDPDEAWAALPPMLKGMYEAMAAALAALQPRPLAQPEEGVVDVLEAACWCCRWNQQDYGRCETCGAEDAACDLCGRCAFHCDFSGRCRRGR